MSGSRGCSTIGKPIAPTRLRHRRADLGPARGRPVEAIDAAMILLIEPIGMPADAAARNAGRARIRDPDRHENRPCTPAFSGRQSVPRVGDSKTPPLDMPMIEMLRIARIDQDRVQLRPVRRAVLVAAAPCPCAADASLKPSTPDQVAPPSVGAEEALRRGPGVPDAPARRVPRREPERVIDGAAAALGRTPAGAPPPSTCAHGRSSERPSGRDGRSAPRRAASCRRAGRAARDGRCAEEVRPGELPLTTRGIAR